MIKSSNETVEFSIGEIIKGLDLISESSPGFFDES